MATTKRRTREKDFGHLETVTRLVKTAKKNPRARSALLTAAKRLGRLEETLVKKRQKIRELELRVAHQSANIRRLQNEIDGVENEDVEPAGTEAPESRAVT